MPFEKVSCTMYTARRKALPKSPTSVDEIESVFKKEYVLQNYGMTHRQNSDDQTLFFKSAQQSGDAAFCVFASDDVINAFLQHQSDDKRKIYADGTFKITPIGIFKQVLIIYCEIHECVSFY